MTVIINRIFRHAGKITQLRQKENTQSDILVKVIPERRKTCDTYSRLLGQIDRKWKYSTWLSVQWKQRERWSDRQIIALFTEIGIAKSNDDVRILIGSSEIAISTHVQYWNSPERLVRRPPAFKLQYIATVAFSILLYTLAGLYVLRLSLFLSLLTISTTQPISRSSAPATYIRGRS